MSFYRPLSFYPPLVGGGSLTRGGGKNSRISVDDSKRHEAAILLGTLDDPEVVLKPLYESNSK